MGMVGNGLKAIPAHL